MKKLLSLPPNLVESFHDITGLSREEYFATSDPEAHRVGSGGGTTWLLYQSWLNDGGGQDFAEWLCQERRILIHAGGQSRRLPAYAPSGKVLTPVPVFRWERGQRLSQSLLDLQLPLYERMMEAAPQGLNTMIVSGDVYISAPERLAPVPEADVVCYGLWLDASVARNHGVFVSERSTPTVLKQMLQKPTTERLSELLRDHYYLTDIGVWLLSDRAVRLLMKHSCNGEPDMETLSSKIKEYDLYSEFGCALGTCPTAPDEELSSLSVAIVPLTGGEFYHFGTSREMISSTVRLQNKVNDQREIMHLDRKPHPSIFTQNVVNRYKFDADNKNIWAENSYIGDHWTLSQDNIVTGVPENDWHVTLQPGQCVDVVPVGETDFCLRLYNIDDRFAGSEQQRQQFPVVTAEAVAAATTTEELSASAKRYLSAEELSAQANLRRLFAQRRQIRRQNWPAMAANWQHSVFYQLDLDDAAREFRQMHIPMPDALPETAPLMTRIHDAMFRGQSDRAFALLREGLLMPFTSESSLRAEPRLSVCHVQIVWSRSPVRIDLAGGWTDTPPYCLMEGGAVVNIAIELNGQPPLQTYIKPCAEPHIVLRSIDLGAMEVVETYEQLSEYNKVGSPFSIPKAALALAGFAPTFAAHAYASLREQLADFGSGIELTLLSAIPAGSGLGTSSILASTVLGAVSDFCGLDWDKTEIGQRTLVLEQLLTTGGGWQDQFGGVLQGVKLLNTERGFNQNPLVRWLPNQLWQQSEYRQCHLLYYTGITRTAKHILGEIVRRMFLNQGGELRQLRQMKQHAIDMYEAIQRQDFEAVGRLVRRTWQQNQLIDSGTCPEQVERLTRLVDDLCLGYKLPGAGGGGYLYMIAKDPEAAARIKQTLSNNPVNANARFVDMTLSESGLQVSRS